MTMERSIMSRNRVSLVLLFATVPFLSPLAAFAVDEPQIGLRQKQMYPDFSLPNVDGGFGRLSDYRGKKVLLIHFASW